MVTRPVKIGNCLIGDGSLAMIAGPCSLEGEEQFLSTALHVQKHGASLLRGGMFKLRTDPNSFQGLEKEAFALAKKVKTETGLSFISEVTDPRQISDMFDVVEAFQVGSRNMHNYALLKELGMAGKPVLLKRGFSGLIKEWLLSAEYLVKAGNDQIVLCERGIRTFETATRNTFDINAIAYVKQHSPFPVVADPSHGTGMTSLVTPIALASAAAGADGIMVEVHPEPPKALSDGFQALNFAQFEDLTLKLNSLLTALGRKLTTV